MPKPRVPTNVLEMRGTFKHDPKRREAREGEPEAVGMPKMPAHLSAAQKKAWKELMEMVHEGTVCAADTFSCEVLCVLLAEFRTTQVRENATGQIVILEMKPARLALLGKLLSSFGLTPGDRSRVKTAKGKTSNPFSDAIKPKSA